MLLAPGCKDGMNYELPLDHSSGNNYLIDLYPELMINFLRHLIHEMGDPTDERVSLGKRFRFEVACRSA